MKAKGLLLTSLLYLGVALLLAEAALATALWARGVLSPEKVVRLAAMADNVDVASIRREMERARRPYVADQFSFDEVLATRALISADRDLRKIALDDGIDDTYRMEHAVEQQYLQLKKTFDSQLTMLPPGATGPAVEEVRRQLEAISPKMAKDQLIRFLDEPSSDAGQKLQFVIAILKSMQVDTQKKILAEFKGEETARLHEILREMGQRLPEVALKQEPRKQLEQSRPQTPAKDPNTATPSKARQTADVTR
jgi:hypothetical protein